MIDYMVMEAVYLKAQKEEREAEKAQKRRNWKTDKSDLDQFR